MNNLSEENAMNLPLENCDYARVGYKHRSVSAVRDFPPVCGPDALRIDVNSHENVETESNMEVDDGLVDRSKLLDGAAGVFPDVCDNPLECGSGVPITNSTPQETTETETGLVEIEPETFLAKLETSEMIHGVTPRKVSATRVFPPFCGRNAPVPTVEDRVRINSRKKSLIAIKENDTECGLLREALNDVPDSLSRRKAKEQNSSGKEKSRSGSEMKTYKNISSRKKEKKSLYVQKSRHEDLYDSVMREDGDFVAGNSEKIEDSSVNRTPSKFEATLPPFGPNTSSHDMRNRVTEALRLFHAVCRKIMEGEEAKLRSGKQSQSQEKIRRIDLAAAKIVKEKGKEVNTDKQILGAVPGVEVGDEFQYRVELAIVGIHRLYQAGIDYMKYKGDEIVAVSIVASGGYADELDNPNVVIYSGQGGLSGKDKQPEDQKLERGNLALKNSIKFKNYVRVIRGSKETRGAKTVMTYVYDGLYVVEKFWQEEGAHGKLVLKFELRRLPGQPELAWKK